MIILDPDGLFNGDRLRNCSSAAQLHFPRLLLASDGFARLEINYPKIIGVAYSTFKPVPSEADLGSWIQEYVKNYLLFPYEVDGRLWGQWDTNRRFLPRFKRASDKRSPIPPEPAFTDWKRQYRTEIKPLPKCFGNISEKFRRVVVVVGVDAVEKNTCASDDARVCDSSEEENLPFATQLDPLPEEVNSGANCEIRRAPKKADYGMTAEQENWFSEWWRIYWHQRAKKQARDAFRKHVKTEERFQVVMAATRAQTPEMLQRERSKRPYASTWLNGERWEDELQPVVQSTSGVGYRDMDDWKKGIVQ